MIKQYFPIKSIHKTFSLLFPYITQQKKAYGGLFLCLLVDISLTFAFAWFLGSITDAAVQSDLQRIKRLIPLGTSFILLSVASAYFNEYLQAVTVNAVKRDLKARLYKHILLLPTQKVENHPSGELLSHFTNDINYIDGIIGMNLMNLIKFPIISVGIFIYLAHISWQLSLLSLIVAPIAVLAGAIFGLLLRRNSSKILKLAADTNTHLNETFWGFLVIRSFTLENLFHNKYLRKNQELYSLELKDAKLRGWFHAGGDFVGSIVFLASLCLGAYFVWNNRITVGSLMSFVNLTNHLVYPLTGLAGLWAGFQRSISAVERILRVLEQPMESVDLSVDAPVKPFLKSIQIRNITFSYDGKVKILEQFHLQIPAGKVVALVGPSGAGKTTLFNLLQGFYKPQTGQILIDDCSTEFFSPSELRQYFAHVPQETYLFGGTIKENLLLARSHITDAEMMHAAMTANIHPFIMSLPDGYDTEVGERGLRLSGGQKQRMAIARAVLKDAPILLLDEATSALDSETEDHVKEALERLMKNRTTLVIAHRLSTVQHADWIIVMDKGKIVQKGRHDELIQEDGLYRRLNRMQLQKGAALGDHFFDSSVV
ncbi:MAG: ABC transporter ATP-binding protein [Paenibacillaceae bacterium]